MEFKGCGSHSCKIAKPAGMATNGPCRCRSNLLSSRKDNMIKDICGEYEAFVIDARTDKIEDKNLRILWALAELNAEVGEINGVIAKALRKHGELSSPDRLYEELGDALWSLTALLLELTNDNGSLEDLMEANMAKLKARINAGISYGTQTNKTQESPG